MIPGDFQVPKLTRGKLLKLGVLGLVSTAGLIVTALLFAFVIPAWLGRPVIFGFNEGPQQPIAYPHTLHAGTDILRNANGTPRVDEQGQQMTGLGLDCTFCHRNVTQGAAATIPPVGLCMTCHKVLGDGLPEVEKLRDYYDPNGDGDPEDGRPIEWVRVHRLPDHVHFVHEAHINFFSQRDGIPASAVCATCHGDVQNMTVVTQVRSLKMGDCVNCHRDNNAPTDCTTCHY